MLRGAMAVESHYTSDGGEAMHSNRRNFLQQSLGLACVAAVDQQLLAETPQASADGDLIARMTWMNEPASWSRSEGKLMVRSRAKTDFWRKTFYGYITDNGHFFHLAASGDFTFQARVNGKYAALYDQAGLMVRLDPENWVKCGTEFFDSQRHASVVFTRDFSDWSTLLDLSSSAPVWWRAVRKKDSIETLCSLDGKEFTSVRQGYFPPRLKVEVGIMCAAPEGSGFEAVFDELKLEV
jgi:regulation of enolase protein 1 (concanavalin A-like superfamily)